MAQPTALDPGVTDVLDLLGRHDGDRLSLTGGSWVDVIRTGQPIDTARVQLTDNDGQVRTYRVHVQPEPT
jgi:hypothetical protein